MEILKTAELQRGTLLLLKYTYWNYLSLAKLQVICSGNKKNFTLPFISPISDILSQPAIFQTLRSSRADVGVPARIKTAMSANVGKLGGLLYEPYNVPIVSSIMC